MRKLTQVAIDRSTNSKHRYDSYKVRLHRLGYTPRSSRDRSLNRTLVLENQGLRVLRCTDSQAWKRSSCWDIIQTSPRKPLPQSCWRIDDALDRIDRSL